METECFCPYCKKKFNIDIVVEFNPYVPQVPNNPPLVSDLGIKRYKMLEEG